LPLIRPNCSAAHSPLRDEASFDNYQIQNDVMPEIANNDRVAESIPIVRENYVLPGTENADECGVLSEVKLRHSKDSLGS
jgi:hypothetical protein